jgi:magnesium transporter
LGSDFVISFQEREGDVFEPVRERLRSPQSRLRTRRADFLAYSLIDAIVDHYFVVLEHVGDQIESLETQLVAQTDADVRDCSGVDGLLPTERLVMRYPLWW